MFDVSIALPGQPGSLARFGEILGAAGVSLEGGGVFTVDGVGYAHFLVEDGEAARVALENAGIGIATVRPVLIRRLKQEIPGQLGAIAGALADAGVNIETQYSDHANRLILVVDDMAAAERVTADWVSA
ncbi:amino acid-binding protein [Sphingomonas sp. RB56-2]|uniref:Amino acid-binding protein n=1 Tax=Sphingomonas brevis TaxID=2908206 RepID=A0ABT0S7C1_9SPHN|nr:amino acid-binding protein [Sphingomonas brevis]MCL6740267.1 amino acid-binding protein [Sphingomonas brevis]